MSIRAGAAMYARQHPAADQSAAEEWDADVAREAAAEGGTPDLGQGNLGTEHREDVSAGARMFLESRGRAEE